MKYLAYLSALIAVIIFIIGIFDLYPIGKWGIALAYVLVCGAVFLLKAGRRRKKIV